MATQTKRNAQETPDDPGQAAMVGFATAVGTASEFQRQQLAAGASPAASMMGVAMNAAAPMADAIQQMFTAPMKAAQASSQSTH